MVDDGNLDLFFFWVIFDIDGDDDGILILGFLKDFGICWSVYLRIYMWGVGVMVIDDFVIKDVRFGRLFWFCNLTRNHWFGPLFCG